MVNRIILGNLGSTYGLKVSKPGIDVTDVNTTSKDLLFDSSNNNFLRSIITGTLSIPSGSAYTSINLGTTYASLMLMGYVTISTTVGHDLSTDSNGVYSLMLSNTGLLTIYRLATSNIGDNSVTYTIFGA